MTSDVSRYSLAVITLLVATVLVITDQTSAAYVIVSFGVLLVAQFTTKK